MCDIEHVSMQTVLEKPVFRQHSEGFDRQVFGAHPKLIKSEIHVNIVVK